MKINKKNLTERCRTAQVAALERLKNKKKDPRFENFIEVLRQV